MNGRTHAVLSTSTALHCDEAPTPGRQTLVENEATGYVVRRGETLLGLSRRYELALRRLVAANPQIKDPDNIYPDQRVWLPGIDGGRGR